MSTIDEFLKELNAQRNNAWLEQKPIVERAARERRDFTTDERVVIERTDTAMDTIDEQIRSWQERQEREREADIAREAYEPVVRPATRGDAHTDKAADEVSAFLRGERRSIELDFRPVAKEKAAIRAGARGAQVRDLLEVASASGGATVPTSFLRQLYDFLEIYSGVRRTNVRVITTASGESLDMPKVASHGTAAIVGEGSALAEVDPTFTKVTLGAWKYGQLLQISSELMSDSGVDIMAFLAEDMGRAIARVTDNAYVNGTGSNAPQGFLPAYATGVTGQNGATGLPSYPNLVDMVYSVNEAYRMRNASWMFRDATVGNIRKIVDTTGQPIWQPSIQAGAPALLLDYPVVTDPNVAAMATGIVCGAFGDFSGFVIRDVGVVRLERSDDYAFNADMTTFRCVFRTDSDVLDPNSLRVYRGGTA